MVRISSWNCVRNAQSMAFGTRTTLQLEILIRNNFSAIHKSLDNTLESSRNVSETLKVCIPNHIHVKEWDVTTELANEYLDATETYAYSYSSMP